MKGRNGGSGRGNSCHYGAGVRAGGLTAGVRRMRGMAVRAVIFDWGGTLTPWHSIDLGELWLAVCAQHYPAEEAAASAAAERAAEAEMWRQCELSHQGATLQSIIERAGVSDSDEFLARFYEAC